MQNQSVSLKQMKKISIIWGLIMVIIVILLIILGIIFNKKNKVYTDMEDNLVEATKKYVEKSFAYPKDDDELRVSYTQLKESGLIDEISINKNECDGYVIVKNNNLVYEYKGYVKCPEYKTKNYTQ